MPLSWALIASLLLAVAGYLIGRNRALGAAGPDVRMLHSRPTYHGVSVALTTFGPAAVIVVLALLLAREFFSTLATLFHVESAV